MRNSRDRVAHHARSLRNEDIRAYLRERSRECDEQIEALRSRINERKRFAATAPLPTSSHRAHMSNDVRASRSLRFEHLDSDDLSTHERDDRMQSRHRSASPTRPHSAGSPRGILKTSVSSPKQLHSTSYTRAAETVEPYTHHQQQQQQPEAPDTWFQRVMRIHDLSPLDLCDRLSLGDARHHATVPLRHVCEQLFALDPDAVANGVDVVTPAMEDWLFAFAYEQSDGAGSSEDTVVVNVKDALRSLDIWRQPATTDRSIQSRPTASSSPVKTTATRNATNKELEAAVARLEDANKRLSKRLETVAALAQSGSRDTATGTPPPPAAAKTQRPQSAQSQPRSSNASLAVATRRASLSMSSLSTSWLAGTNGVDVDDKPNDSDDVLAAIAQHLQYAGVKKLEELLDTTTPHDRSSIHDDSTSAAADTVSSKDDNDAFVSLKQLQWLLHEHFGVAVRATALVESCLGLPFNARGHVDRRAFVRVLLDLLVYAPTPATASAADTNDTVDSNYTDDSDSDALDWRFWCDLRTALNGSDNRSALEPAIHTQLCRIFRKAETSRPRRYGVSPRVLTRVLERHVSASQLATLRSALAQPSDGNSSKQPTLRYDVFMKLVFGAPRLQDDAFLREAIAYKLIANEAAVRKRVVALQTAHGGDYSVTLSALYALTSQSDSSDSQSSKPGVLKLTTCELLYLFARLDNAHAGYVTLETLSSFLTTECWSVSSSSRDGNDVNDDDKVKLVCAADRHSSSSGSAAIRTKSTRRALCECLDAYDLERALERSSRAQHGCVAQDELVEAIDCMLETLSRAADSNDSSNEALAPKRIQQFVSSVAATFHNADAALARSGRLKLALPVAAFIDTLFDWRALTRRLQLPHKLNDAKRVLERFDWHRDGCIAADDWHKALRQLSGSSSAMADWEVRVLQRRFPGSKDPLSNFDAHQNQNRIDYARLLVYLLDAHHARLQQRATQRVVTHLQARRAHSTEQIEQLYERMDCDNKGHINIADLAQYVAAYIVGHRQAEVTASNDDDGSDRDSDCDADDRALVQNVNVLSHVLAHLAGADSNSNSSSRAVSTAATRATTVPRARFHAFMRELAATATESLSTGRQHSSSPPSRVVLTSVRALELALLDICSVVARVHGTIQPTRAFRYLSGLPTMTMTTGSPRRLTRTSTPKPTACMPLTSATLQRVLQAQHKIVVSNLIVTHLFAHIHDARTPSPSTTQQLGLVPFAKWLAPLAPATAANVRTAAKRIAVRSKAGGGRIDVTRFMRQLFRKLLDAPMSPTRHRNALGTSDYRNTSDTNARDHDPLASVRVVPLTLLLHTLAQLDVILSRVDAEALLRHVGMDDDAARVDVARFVERILDVSARQASDYTG